jgi:threonine dehydrogenase-like Zn-dependent dehydrogenase
MQVKLLYTIGDGCFKEIEWCKPEITIDEIEVQAVYTGVCRSDIDMMMGNFGPLPLHMQGHEGVGIVTAVGSCIKDVKVGDFVATRGEPAYATMYNVKFKEYVKIPELSPKYILEPVACGINLIAQPIREIAERSGPNKRLLILGSGMLAWIAYQTIKLYHLEFDVTVVGSSNKELWGDKLQSTHQGTFEVVIDISSKLDVFTQSIVNNESLIIFGAQKAVTTDFGNLLWKACTIIFPSPRTDKFYGCMRDAETWITSGELLVDKLWTRGYNRSTEWENAFADGLNRADGYSRGYIEFDRT